MAFRFLRRKQAAELTVREDLVLRDGLTTLGPTRKAPDGFSARVLERVSPSSGRLEAETPEQER